MRTIRTKIYKFNELSNAGKEAAIEWYRNTNVEYEYVFESIKDDAENIELEIYSLDDHKPNSGEFIESGESTANKILANHGKDCETYKTATNFLQELKQVIATTPVVFEEGTEDEYEDYYDRNFEIHELEISFKESLLEDYRIMYNNDVDYQNSDAAITENIIANEYEFTKDGRMI